MSYHCAEPERYERQGFPEAIYCPGKTARQIVVIARELAKGTGPVIATRADRKIFTAIKRAFPKARYCEAARIAIVREGQMIDKKAHGRYICVVTAGTTDIAVAEEAAVTAEVMGTAVERIYDVGVAGVHRLLHHNEKLRKASAVVVCAGMEGALASVVGGLVRCPVVGVPTSVGYGAAFGGIAALLSILNSCAPNVSAVNIDDGFGAGIIASMICGGTGK